MSRWIIEMAMKDHAAWAAFTEDQSRALAVSLFGKHKIRYSSDLREFSWVNSLTEDEEFRLLQYLDYNRVAPLQTA